MDEVVPDEGACVAADVELVRHCLLGQESAMRTLVERYQSDVYGLCVHMLRHNHDAEDVVQEVFLRVFRSLKCWDSARPLRPWIMTIAVNRCRTWLSRRVRIPEPVEHLNDVPSRPHDAPEVELTEALHEAIGELRVEYREAFILFHEQGRSYEEIAEVMQRPVGTIKTWLHRARAQLLTTLQCRGQALDMMPEPKPTTP